MSSRRNIAETKPPVESRRAEVEEALRLSEEKFLKVFHGNPNPALISRLEDARVLEANEAFCRWFGISLAEARGKTSFDLGIWESDEERAGLVKVVLEKGALSNYEKVVKLPSGEIRVTLLASQRLMVQGEECLLTITTDITRQKQAEQALQQSEERLRRALEAARLGTWEWDIPGNHVVWSENVPRLFGLLPGQFGGTFEAFLELVEPDDRDRVNREINEAIEGRTHGYYSEFRVRWPDQSVHWNEGRGQVHRDSEHRPVQMVGTVVDITDRKVAELALRESEERFRCLAASAFEGIAITDHGRFADLNDQMAEMLGYRREELIGRLVSDCVAAESLPLVNDMMKSGNDGPYEHLALRKDGTTFPVEVHAKPFPFARRKLRVTSIRNITERRNAETALRNSEESLRATIENTPYVGVQWYDEQGRILFWNHASEAMYGWTASEAAGKTLGQLIFTPDHAAQFLNLLDEIGRTGKPAGPREYPFHRKDGSNGSCLSTVFSIPFAAGKSCFVCMDVDLTARKQAEQSLREAQERELQARDGFARQLLNDQENERQRLASELHDGLGQNLSIIKNTVDLALKPNDPASTPAHLEAISRFASEAIAEVRNLARNLRPLQIKQLGLTDSLGELVDNVAQSTAIRIERRLEEVDDVVHGEAATHLYRIVQEALNNLIKHSGAGRANVSLERDVNCVRLIVTDDGTGFEVKNAFSRGGLGLTSIGERARMLGGSFKIQSVAGEGTRLTIELPIHDDGGPET
jgi:PAS domain S-box-containing protein